MRTRALMAIVAFLVAAAVGIAMAATGSLDQPAQPQRGRPAERPMGPPQGPRGGGPEGIGRLAFELDLAAAQLDQIRELTAAGREAHAAIREQLQEIADRMRPLIEAESFDEAAVRDLAAKEAALTTELRVSGARIDAAIYKLLTAEQKAALKNLRDRRPPRMRGR